VLFDGAAVTVTVAITATLYIGLWFGLGMVRDLAGKHSR
jgi:hypothetical protein